MPKLLVDGIEVEVPEGSTVMQACEEAGAEIPRFCYHERLSIAGNCRMCLVELDKSPKPIASCAMPAGEGMVLRTNTKKVKKAREGVMEFLLINHPLDCPICDQGGECDLQDQSIYYGNSKSRYLENKRAVKEKNFGPLVKTVMTRCIHCTRCVRFMDELAGVHALGAINRGEETEISSVLEEGISSELSGNIIDLCPVGALTSKPYAFTARSWELMHTESIDTLDALGSNIRIDHFGGTIKRVVPINNDSINQEWLSDKSRFSYDGLANQRLDTPYIKKNNKYVAVNWSEALKKVSDKIKSLSKDQIASISGDHTDLETLVVAKDMLDKLGVNNRDCRYEGSQLPTKGRHNWLFNTKISGIDKSDVVLFIGCDPKKEAPLISARFRQRWLTGELKAYGLGCGNKFPFEVENVGTDFSILEDLKPNSKLIKLFKNSLYPTVIIGESALKRDDAKDVHYGVKLLCQSINAIRDDWCGFSILHTNASRVGGLEVGFTPKNEGKNSKQIIDGVKNNNIKLLYLLDCDDINLDNTQDAFIVYQGHHGDKAASKADVILPSSAYTEKRSMYVNLEGRPQFTNKAVDAPGDARDGWKIIRALSAQLSLNLNYNNHKELLKRIYAEWQHLSLTGEIVRDKWVSCKAKSLKISKNSLDYDKDKDYYMTCSISRASKTMAECSRTFSANKGKKL